jgi:hypothetical protein
LIRHTGLVAFAAEIALVPVLALTKGSDGALAGAAVGVPMLVKRVLGNTPPAEFSTRRDRSRVYFQRLLFDRDPAPGVDQ